MSQHQSIRKVIPPFFRTLIAVLIGFYLAELIVISWRTPQLWVPSNFKGLVTILLSGIALYLGIGIALFVFALLLKVTSKLFRIRLTVNELALTTLVAAPLFLMLQNEIQGMLWGWKVHVKSLGFFLPTGICLILLIAGVGLVKWMVSRLPNRPTWFRRISEYPGIVVPSAILMAIYALSSGIPMQPDLQLEESQQRNQRMEYRLEDQPQAPSGAPNFIVLVIECFRTDVFSSEKTPFLWKLAQENVYFSNYYVTAPTTRPSVTSLFTSLHPLQHGCYNLAPNETVSDHMTTIRASQSAQGVGKLLHDQGYRTLMVTSNQLTTDPIFGFEEIYTRFESEDPHQFRFPYVELFGGFHFLKQNLRVTRIFKKMVFFSPEHSQSYFIAPRLNKTVIREMNRQDSRPFFLYVHYMEPHAPYYEHPFQPVQINLYLPSQRDKLFQVYESEVQEIDRWIEKLYKQLQATGQLNNTYLFITSDHGEEFYDHGHWGHGKGLYPEVLHVPTILVMPPDKKQRMTIDSVAQNVDIAPTITQLADIEPSKSWEGHSLISLIQPKENPHDAGSRNEERLGANNDRVAFSQFQDRKLFMASAITEQWQIILHQQGNTHQQLFYCLADDPRAENNIAGIGYPTETLMAEILQKNLNRLHQSAQIYQGEEEIIDESQLEQLQVLGYID